jgi:two-component system C4-dicarboxylate transport response regulator DctD
MTSPNPEGRSGFRVMVIEDDESFLRSVVRSLELSGHKVTPFTHPRKALENLALVQPEVVLTDLVLGDMSGMEVLTHLRTVDPSLPVVMMTAVGNIPTAIQAVRTGAYDFLEKPFDSERLLGVLQRGVEQYRLAVENRSLKDLLGSVSGLDRVLRGESAGIRQLRALIARLAPLPTDVMVLGETGTGKELVARCLHGFSGRAGRFVAINCAALPENLFESELFGHVPGAYTGASKQRVGKIEHADRGTLFLDEIETMPLHLQAKLLRVLQERQVERLGSNQLVPVDVRVVAATKVDLRELGEKQKFRPDLFFRLNVANVRIPPLRERREDVPLLFAHFVREAALRFAQEPAEPTVDVQQRLVAYEWPGNVRELRNAAEQWQLGIPLSIGDGGEGGAAMNLAETIASVERALIDSSLRRHKGDVDAVSRELGVDSSTLYRKMRSHEIVLAGYRDAAAD